MNKAALIEHVANKAGMSDKQAGRAVEACFDTIIREVVKGGRVSVTGFGTFEKVERPARFARNPQNGERVKVKKRSVPRFRPGQNFKDLVNKSKRMPAWSRASCIKKKPKTPKESK